MRPRSSTFLPFGLLAVACTGGGGSGAGGEPPAELVFERVGGAFTFPVYLTSPPADPRLFVVEKGGAIRIVEAGQQLPVPFLDLSASVGSGDEQGLLGLAFDPDFAANGRFYVHSTDPSGATVIARYRVQESDPDRADAGSAEVVLAFARPSPFHNGGMIAFGPDGYLYIASGDGGDPENGQSQDDLFGSILRIDVSGPSGYAIPPDNPFAGSDAPELWDVGLRNPWRFSFDRQTGDLYVADVGEMQFEEISVSRASAGRGRGANYGWSVLEGTACMVPGSLCEIPSVLPVRVYDHSEGCSVIGGYVYRGAAIPGLAGTYFHADFCTGVVRSFRLSGDEATEVRAWGTFPDGHTITSFGEDAQGELYVVTGEDAVYRIAAP